MPLHEDKYPEESGRRDVALGGGLQSVPVQLIRSNRVRQMADSEGECSDLPNSVRQFISAAAPEGFIPWLNRCTHFCCVPGWKTQVGSAACNAGNDIYCQCHQSVCDPFSPVLTQFAALPRPPAGGGESEYRGNP